MLMLGFIQENCKQMYLKFYAYLIYNILKNQKDIVRFFLKDVQNKWHKIETLITLVKQYGINLVISYSNNRLLYYILYRTASNVHAYI